MPVILSDFGSFSGFIAVWPLHTYSKDHQVHDARALVVLSLLIFVSVLDLVVGVCTARSEQSSAQLFWPRPNPNEGLGAGKREVIFLI